MTDTHAHHDHPPFLGHHWDSPQQQFEAGKLGMWLFLATEVLLFGGLFVGYSVWRGNNPDLWGYGSHYLDTTMGAINTVVLILSSLTMAMAVTYAQTNRKQAMLVCLGLTFLGGAIFMGIKYVEYTAKFKEGIFPGQRFYEGPPNIAKSKYWQEGLPIIGPDTLAEIRQAKEEAERQGVQFELTEVPAFAERSSVQPAPIGVTGFSLERVADTHKRGEKSHVHPLQDPHRPANAHMFFNIYFMMTGLHGIHVIIGMIVIGWLIVRGMRGDFSSEYFTPVDLGGLYWHVVDLIWIFLFPLFYLI